RPGAAGPGGCVVATGWSGARGRGGDGRPGTGVAGPWWPLGWWSTWERGLPAGVLLGRPAVVASQVACTRVAPRPCRATPGDIYRGAGPGWRARVATGVVIDVRGGHGRWSAARVAASVWTATPSHFSKKL